MRDYSDKWNNMILHRSGLSDSQLKHFEFEIDFLEIEKMIKSEFVYFDNSYDSHSSCNIEKESKCGDHQIGRASCRERV